MPTEQLKIDAVLDTKNLKRESKDAAQEMTGDLNQIGNAADSAAQKMEKSFSSSFDRINAQAKQVKDTVQKMASVGIAAQALNIAGGAIASTEFGQTDTGKFASNALTGAGSGAMSGMMLGTMLGGPAGAAIGAAAGALIGAGKGLMDASTELKNAAREQKDALRGRLTNLRDDINREDAAKKWQNQLDEYAKAYNSRSGLKQLDILINSSRDQYNDYGKEIRDYINSDEAFRNPSDARLEEMEELRQRQQRLQNRINDLLALRSNIQADLVRKDEEEKRRKDALAKEEQRRADETAKAEAAILKSKQDEAQKLAEKSRKDAIENLKTKMSDNKEKQSVYESDLSKVLSQNRTLSDSLTRVGGTTGYGQINNSINANVSKIAASILTLIKEAQKQYTLLETKLGNTVTTWSP